MGFDKLFYGQMKSCLYKLKMIWRNSLDIRREMNELFSPTGIASQLLYSQKKHSVSKEELPVLKLSLKWSIILKMGSHDSVFQSSQVSGIASAYRNVDSHHHFFF